VPFNVAQKLIQSHLVEGRARPGEEIGLKIDQTLTQDATGTLVMLELEAMDLDRVRTEISVQYVDHNLLQEDYKNADDHLFLESACRRFGVWYSRPGNGVSHALHQERFGKPGKTLLGSDSHTCAAGSLGMLAIGAGGLDVAMAMAGLPFHVRMPEIWGVRLAGELPPWISAKDVILEMLRRHSVAGGVHRIIEYYGPGLRCLSAMDRHVIANMGAELGATTTVFPSDAEVRRFLSAQGRGEEWTELIADAECSYDQHDEIDLSRLEPLIAMPSSPDSVRPVREVAGQPIYQAYIGSSANPGYRDLAIVAAMVRGQRVPPGVSLDINPTSRQILENLVHDGHIAALIRAGARLHQAGCNGCIGMGQAPATDKLSLRTVPRNFPGRSGTRDDQVCLVSPETAAASALRGVITDPRQLGIPYPHVREPEQPILNIQMFEAPVESPIDHPHLEKGPNIKSLPEFEPLPSELEIPVLLKVGDNISTDEILPAGARVLPFRSNIQGIAQFAFAQIDDTYHERALSVREAGGHVVVGGSNYGQGSSREHAALAPRYLGLRAVLAKSFARIHRQNLVNFGVLPLVFSNPADYELLSKDETIRIIDIAEQLKSGREIIIHAKRDIPMHHALSPRQMQVLLEGGLINWVRAHHLQTAAQQ
jgi:aconitate hydratase